MLFLQTFDVFYCFAASIALNMNDCTESWWVITDVGWCTSQAIPQISFQHLLNYIYFETIYILFFIWKGNKSVPCLFHEKRSSLTVINAFISYSGWSSDSETTGAVGTPSEGHGSSSHGNCSSYWYIHSERSRLCSLKKKIFESLINFELFTYNVRSDI